jgi:hypothetical protein
MTVPQPPASSCDAVNRRTGALSIDRAISMDLGTCVGPFVPVFMSKEADFESESG